jgi:hypothetical protein
MVDKGGGGLNGEIAPGGELFSSPVRFIFARRATSRGCEGKRLRDGRGKTGWAGGPGRPMEAEEAGGAKSPNLAGRLHQKLGTIHILGNGEFS